MDEIFWTEEALQDLQEIDAFISPDRPRAAKDVVRRIVETVSALAYHPRMGRADEETGTRRLIALGTPYIVVYRLRERIEIVTIFHGARKWPDHFGH